jgi:hypothetical protein
MLHSRKDDECARRYDVDDSKKVDNSQKVDITSVKECDDYVQKFHRIIEQYSALKLTKSSDRLPALSGLCKPLQPIRGRYAAGLWMDSIHFDLLWRVDTRNLNTPSSANNDDYRGPSWSWVAVNDPVHYWTDIVNFFENLFTCRSPVILCDGVVYSNYQYSSLLRSKARCLGQNTNSIFLTLKTVGQNLYGSVLYASLTVEASSTTATVKYIYDTYGHDGLLTPNLSRYMLSFVALVGLHMKELNEVDIELPFFADYQLAAEGQYHVPNNKVVSLLLVHPRVALVLLQVSDGPRDPVLCRRIGIVRISIEMASLYDVDWMGRSSVQKFTII